MSVGKLGLVTQPSRKISSANEYNGSQNRAALHHGRDEAFGCTSDMVASGSTYYRTIAARSNETT